MASTTKQIADLLGCPKMRVYRYIQRECISESFCNGSVKYYDDDTVSAIIAALQPVLDSESDRNGALQIVTDCNTETVTDRNNSLQTVTDRNAKTVTERNDALQNVTDRNTEILLEMLREQLAAKDKQLEVKDEQLSAKDKQIEALNVALTTAQQTIADTTAALTAAQALHAGTLQRLPVAAERDENEAVEAVPDPPTMTEEQAQPKKKGFFARLFGK